MRALLQNLRAGVRLATYQRVAASDFRVSAGQLAWLSLIDFALGVGIAFSRLDGDAGFNPGVIVQALAAVAITLALAALFAAWLRQAALLPGFAVAATAMAPLFTLYGYAGYALWQWLALALHDGVWLVLWLLFIVAPLLVRAIALWTPLGVGRRLVAELVLVATLLVQWTLAQENAWYPVTDDADTALLDAGRHEALLYRQADLLDRHLAALAPQRPGVNDLYFVGFAGDGWQDVFMKEVASVRALFDRRFDTDGRSLSLVNNAATRATTPMATTTALERSLSHVGQLIDPDEDVLFLFLTSHGSEAPSYLSVSHDGLSLTQVTPARLKAALAATAVRWKVVVVSACYSGGFIPALQDDDTLLITAARADRSSFGCADRHTLTDFGRAYFAEALNRTRSFTAAFELARRRIAEREASERLTASEPQIRIGKNFAARWQGRYVGADAGVTAGQTALR